jgi:hypothetical protein
MGLRRIGQEVLRFEAKVRPTSLDELHALLNWAPGGAGCRLRERLRLKALAAYLPR